MRGTFNGIAAGAGKLGAIGGIWIFEKINEIYGVVPLMVVVGLLNLLGAVISQVELRHTHTNCDKHRSLLSLLLFFAIVVPFPSFAPLPR